MIELLGIYCYKCKRKIGEIEQGAKVDLNDPPITDLEDQPKVLSNVSKHIICEKCLAAGQAAARLH